jgi:hypothetical protein
MAHETMKEEEARQGQVSERMGRLEEAVGKLIQLVGRVEDRLGPILRIIDEDEGKPGVEEGLVPLAESLDTLVMRVERQLRRLASILDRLEL